MINTSGSSSPARRRCSGLKEYWEDPSPMKRHYGHVFLAIILFFVSQLLKCAWDQPFWNYNIDFPGQIMAMVFVWLFLWAVQLAFFRSGEGLERFYHRYLRAPTEVLNKHMSIGFTIPFLSLISQSFAGGDQVGLLTTAFVVTGILNAIFVYAVAYHVQLRLTRLGALWPHTTRQHTGPDVLDVASPMQHRDHHLTRPDPTAVFPRHPATGGGGFFPPPQSSADPHMRGGGSPDSLFRASDRFSCLDRFRKHVSDVSTLCTLSGYASDTGGGGPNLAYGEETPPADAGRPADALRRLESGTGGASSGPKPASSRLLLRMRRTFLRWAEQNIFLTLSVLLFLVIGLPVSSLCHNDLFLDTGFLFTVWLTFTSAQTRVKHHLLHSSQHKKSLTATATLLNPVLWTSLFLLCYGLAKSHIHALPTATVVARFKTGTTVSDLIAHHLPSTPTNSSNPLFGAGDLATSILNAGIVSWGLKLFEYRRQILSRGGLTVLVTSALAALFNVIAWPLLARVLGVSPAAYDLSFAARSVTIALGGPAMASLGGDAGVNAVGVVVNGIVFQLVAGCFVGGSGSGFVATVARWRRVLGARILSLRCGGTEGWASGDAEKAQQQQQVPLRRDDNVRYSSDATNVDGHGRHTPTMGAVVVQTTTNTTNVPVDDDDVPTVAAGVTIGINAAAMGTAHLYEQNSHAAPYSALAMTTFGVFTVLVTVQSPLVEWLKGVVGG